MNYEQIAEYSQIASAALFVAVMVWIWIKFIQPAVVAAQQNSNKRIAEAEQRRDAAKAKLDGLQNAIADARHDAEAIKTRAQQQAEAEKRALIQDAREAGERSLRNASGELERARAAARGKYRDELLERALELARAQAQDRVDDNLNRQLVSRFVNTLGRSN